MSRSARIVPHDKGDEQAVVNLRRASRGQVIAELAPLLSCIADGNWPIAHGVKQVLVAYVEELQPALREVLQGNDGPWKYECIAGIIAKNPAARNQAGLVADLRRLARQPSLGDQEEGIDELAREVLRSWGLEA